MLQRIAHVLKMQPPVYSDAGLLFASGATVPTDGTLGYQVGCIFQHTDGGAGTAVYINEGSYTSCDFNPVEPVGSILISDLADVGATAYTAGKIIVADGDSYEEVAVSGDATLASSGALSVTVVNGVTAGTASASKAVILDSSKDNAGIRHLTLGTNGAGGAAGQLILRDGANPGYASTVQTDAQTADLTVHIPDPGLLVDAYVALSTAALTAAEVDVLDGVVAGTVAANKAVVVDASKDASAFGNVGAATVTAPVIVMTGTTGNQEIRLTANLADALSVEDTTGDLVVFDTTTNALAIKVDKDTEVKLGASASVVGSGFPLDATRTAAMSVFTDDNNAAIGSGTLTRSGRFRSLLTYTGGNREQEAVGLIGQIVSVAGTNRHNMAGLMGSYEASTSLVVDGQASTTDPWIQAGIIGRVGVGTAITTINANGILAGVAAMSNTASFAANNGTYCGFYAGAWSGAINWDYGLYVEPSEVNCGIAVGKFASSYATGSGLVFTATNTAVSRFYGESTSDLTNAVNARTGVFRHLIVTASATVNHETYGLVGQCNVKNTTLGHLHAGLMGTFEVNTAATVNGAYNYGVGAVNARLGVGTSILTCTKPISAFSAIYNGGALASGSSVAFSACSTTATNFTYLLAGSHFDNFLYVATGVSYEAGLKLATVTPGGTGDGVIRIYVGATPYYIPFYAAGSISGE